MKIALTHDVDRTKKSYQYLTYLLKALKNHNFKQFNYHLQSIFSRKEPYWNFDKIIEIENNFNVRSTFFFLNESIKFNFFDISNWQLSLGRYKILDSKIIEIIKYLDKNGWEIGLHGSYNSFNNQKLLKKEKKILENILGHSIIGTRQHYLNMDSTTWKIQKEIGLKYDSTFGYRNNIGYKDHRIFPFSPFDNEFKVYPLAVMDVCFMNINNRWEKLDTIIEETESNNGVLVINWHQRVFNKNEFPGYLNSYKQIIEKLKNKNADFFTLKEIYGIKGKIK